MNIDFTRLRYFLAVADELHFKRAADRLHITPPPLSKQIKLLEREVGGELFDRKYHDVSLTPLGVALVEPARRILAVVREFETVANEMTGRAGPLSVGATAFARSDLLDEFEEAIARLNCTPTRFSLPGSTAEVAAHLVAGHLDLGFVHLPCPDPRIEFRVILESAGGIAVRSDDPLAGRAAVTIDDLRDREVAVDIARANQFALDSLTRRLRSLGIHNIVEAAHSRGSEIELAAQVRRRRLVLMVAYAPDSSFGKLFSPPEFTLVPIEDPTWKPAQLALAWCRDQPQPHVARDAAIDEIMSLYDGGPHGLDREAAARDVADGETAR
ncbi:LysR family transcriptional regulator [Gordonia humi]|uniref:DNA-binding transcriptional LysR family regulator n=1 Tax=Gordonia humi TaxID=686429 RepID=A0A840F2P0_9ACTN|nr:LysR family transcriptional regulator [Gordonia humi]MBB4133837.1 DNA-binding transcriptional LysR family regulator [Gordonia humi]